MLLRETKSVAQVKKALEAGDEELAMDIEETLDDMKREWERNANSYCEYIDNYDADSAEMHSRTEEFFDAVVEASRDTEGFPLDSLPEKDVADAIRNYSWDIVSSAEEIIFSYPVEVYLSCYFPDSMIPDGAENIPPDLASKFWDDLGPEWDKTDKICENYGSLQSGDWMYIVAGDGRSDSDFYEFCADTIRESAERLIRKDRPKAIELFECSVEDFLFERENSPSDNVVRDALHLMDEEEADDYMSSWFSNYDEASREELLGELIEFWTMMDPVKQPADREVIAQFNKIDIKKMGITKGVLYESAPWQLVKLVAADLPAEGRMMRHCVGQRSMGYMKAVADGDVEIWSLRPTTGKRRPRFTLEVDPAFYTTTTTIRHSGRGIPKDIRRSIGRGHAILQLKGKANRTPGYSEAGSPQDDIRFPEEIVFWAHVFSGMDVAPHAVEDFKGFRHIGKGLKGLVSNTGRRRRARSFDKPYTPPR